MSSCQSETIQYRSILLAFLIFLVYSPLSHKSKTLKTAASRTAFRFRNSHLSRERDDELVRTGISILNGPLFGQVELRMLPATRFVNVTESNYMNLLSHRLRGISSWIYRHVHETGSSLGRLNQFRQDLCSLPSASRRLTFVKAQRCI